MTQTKEWLEEEDVLPFMQLMFIVGKAMKIHPWKMQEAIEKEEYPIGSETKITRLDNLRSSYESTRQDHEKLPGFDDILDKVAWIVAAPDDAGPADYYLSRMNCAIDEYSRDYLKPEGRIHKHHD